VLLFEGDGAVRLSDAAIATKPPKVANFGCLLSEPPPGRTLQERMRQLARAVRRPAKTGLVRCDGGYIIGHPSYLAPELLAGRACDMSPAADIYALGTLWYAMLVGRPPFEGHHWQAKLDNARQATIGPPSTANPAVPRLIDELVLICLNREPARRPPASELVERIGV
jgi:serine/threonine protein kinase